MRDVEFAARIVMNATTSTTPESPAGLSTISRITNVFFAPSTTFSDLKRDPSWWVAWLLISVSLLTFALAIRQKVGFRQLVQNDIAASPARSAQLEKAPPESREQQLEIGGKIAAYIWYAMPILLMVIYSIVAAVLMGTFNFGLGTEVPFRLALAVVFYSFLPGIIKWLLGAILLFAGASTEGFDARNPLATNLGYFLNRVDHPVLNALGSSVDIFGIWIMILLGIGFASVSKAKRSTAIAVVATWYVVVTLIGAGFAAL